MTLFDYFFIVIFWAVIVCSWAPVLKHLYLFKRYEQNKGHYLHVPVPPHARRWFEALFGTMCAFAAATFLRVLVGKSVLLYAPVAAFLFLLILVITARQTWQEYRERRAYESIRNVTS
jgi:hypothetical protein